MNVDHSHCPDGCEHPQPIRMESWGLFWGGTLTLVTPRLEGVATLRNIGGDWQKLSMEICGRCWHRFGEFVTMVPCTPEICAD
jgi:hypothetical protein